MTTEVQDRVAGAEAASARRHPVKAAKRLAHYQRQLEAIAAGTLTLPAGEAEQLPHRVAGIRAALAGTSCRACGRPLKDEKQPGYAEGIGPDCWAKGER